MRDRAKDKNIAALLDALWVAGGYEGLTNRRGLKLNYRDAVDGIIGNLTRQAIENLRKKGYNINKWDDLIRKSGYKIDPLKGTITEIPITLLKPSKTLSPRKSGLASMYEMTHAALTGGMSNTISSVKDFLSSKGVPTEQVRNLKLPKNAVDRNGNLTPECAAYVNGVLNLNGIESWGNSYAINSQFKNFVNGYDKINYTPNPNSTSDITKYHKLAADLVKNSLDTLQMNPNHVYTANMYYTNNRGIPSSHTVDFYNKAKEEGRDTYATHVGAIYHDKNANLWRVVDNVHGSATSVPLTFLLGSQGRKGITAISDAGLIK